VEPTEFETKFFKDPSQRYFGDSTLYAGMHAYVGTPGALDYVGQCVDSRGRLWRNPFACRNGTDTHSKVSTSRDMWMGWLLASVSPQHGELERALVFAKAYAYQLNNKGRLSPEADARVNIRPLGWAYLYLAARQWNVESSMPWHRRALAVAQLPLLGIIDFLSCFFVYRHYQINLIYCSLLFRQAVGMNRFDRWLLKKTCWVLRNLRSCDDGVLLFLEGNLRGLIEEHVRAWESCKTAELNHPTWTQYMWTPGYDSPGFGRQYPHYLYIEWCRVAPTLLARRKKEGTHAK
jgi:hypothetical protein